LPAAPSSEHETAETIEDVEFENAWETTSDWNEDDEEDVKHENELCFPGENIGYRSQIRIPFKPIKPH
jgi:CTD kinase subunit gamma